MSKAKVADRAEVVELVIQEKKLGDSAQSSPALSLKFSIKKLKVVRPEVIQPQSHNESDELKVLYYICARHSGDLTNLVFSKMNRITG